MYLLSDVVSTQKPHGNCKNYFFTYARWTGPYSYIWCMQCDQCLTCLSLFVYACVPLPPKTTCSGFLCLSADLFNFRLKWSLTFQPCNNYLHSNWDKFHMGSIDVLAQPTSLSRLLVEVGLRDIWHLRFSDTIHYSCYCSSHHSLSRIDQGVESDSLLPYVKIVEYLVRNISDHSPIRVQLHLGTGVMLPRHFSQLNPFWVHLIHPSLTEETQSLFDINEGSSSTGCVWDTMKAFVRGVYIRDISKCKTKTRELTTALQNRILYRGPFR